MPGASNGGDAAAAPDSWQPAGGRRRPAADKQEQQQECQQQTQQQHPQQHHGGHGPALGTYLLVSSVMAPALLAEPAAFASLSWAGGVAANVVMGLASFYCMFHQALLFHYKGGRHGTYRRMGDAILAPHMGRWGGLVICALQYIVNVGSTITNMILAGQLLQSIYTNLCTTPACTLTGTSAWIGLSGLISLVVFVAVTDMSTLAWASICGTLLMLWYCLAGMVMAGLDGNAAAASYAVPGAPRDRVFNALNGIGILLFLYGVTVLPEIQDVLADSPRTGNSTRTMLQAAVAAHCIFVPLYMLVGIIGYWAYGADVNAFLLFANTRPRWLVVSAELAAAVQIQLVSQVMMIPIMEAVERGLMARLRHDWLRKPHHRGRAPGAAAPPQLSCQASLSRQATLASNVSSFVHAPVRQLHLTASGRLASLPLPAEGGAADWEQPPPPAAAAAAAAQQLLHADGGDAAHKQPQPQRVAHAASIPLMLLTRTLITGLMLLVACALPFFSSIMGAVGALFFGPLTYVLPTVLYLVAFGGSMPAWQRACDVAFIAFWLAASLAGGVGAVYSIVQTASTYKFFS